MVPRESTTMELMNPTPSATRSMRNPGSTAPPAPRASIAIARKMRLRFKPSAIVFDARARWNAEGECEVVASLDARRRAVDNHAPLAVPTNVAGWSSLVARWAHNPKVAGSNPAPATNGIQLNPLETEGLLFLEHFRSNSPQPRPTRPKRGKTQNFRRICSCASGEKIQARETIREHRCAVA